MSKHKYKNLNNRRSFLRNMVGAGCASLTLTPFLSTITNLGLLNASAASNRPIYSVSNPSDYKALVCIMLAGGNDSFNMLVPSGSDGGSSGIDGGEYKEYENARGDIALLQGDLLGINPENPDQYSREFGLHPEMDNIKKLFNGESIVENGVELNPMGQKYVSFVANVGTLHEPLGSVSNLTNSIKPNQLFSHYDQHLAWQTGVVLGERKTGWGGHIADILQQGNSNQGISMNISLNGFNFFQRGNTITEYTVQSIGNGSIRLCDDFYKDELYGGNNLYHAIRAASVDSLVEQTYQNKLQEAYAGTLKQSLAQSDTFSSAISNSPLPFDYFPDSNIGKQLQMVAKSIASRNMLGGSGVDKQTFFVSMGTFDTHDNLLEEHEILMEELDEAIYAFYKAMKEIGDSEFDGDFLDRVTGFTMSDFARTLTSNGDGTDHAWGGHHLVFGGEVDGGKIFGEYPDLAPNSPEDLDIGNGRFIPTTSCDEYFADLAMWFADHGSNCVDDAPVIPGSSSLTFSELQDILPNIGNFGNSPMNNEYCSTLNLFV